MAAAPEPRSERSQLLAHLSMNFIPITKEFNQPDGMTLGHVDEAPSNAESPAKTLKDCS